MSRFFALFDAAGLPQRFWTDDVRDPADNPAETVELTAEQAQEFADNQSRRRWNGAAVEPYEAPDAPVAAPQIVTMRQARLAMLGAGILDDVEAAIAAMPGDEGKAARIEWEYAATLRRGHPLVVGLGPSLGMDAAAIDALFAAAAAIPE